jgi:branched-subunit amino acid aminotransferase/4-amino-4-deoxychorismate lyase
MDSNDAPGGYSLLETMRVDEGVVARLDRHLARMRGSAETLGFAWREAHVRAAVERARAAHATGLWRMRLVVGRAGAPAASCTPHAEHARVWRIGVAPSAVDSGDPLLRHKTTARGIYTAARASRADLDDVLLRNERGEVTESTIANIVADLGALVTPPAGCGLLPGVLRSELLDQGVLAERVLTLDDVRRARRVWLINSLRGWIDVTIEWSST